MKKNICFFTFIFCISLHTGAQIITTIAGGMQIGYSGDGGPATAALLNAPEGITVDASGNVYFGDALNYCVRKIDASGTITRFAGNGNYGASGEHVPATSVSLYYPQSVAVDSLGNVYICDDGGRILKVNSTTGIVTRFAGNGAYAYSGDGGLAVSATLSNPTNIAIDKKGNLYISDFGNYRVRKVDTAGIITTIAGSGGFGLIGDGGPATSATFMEIYGLAVDAMGNVFVADAKGQCIRKIDISGIITTVAGNHYGAGTYIGGYSGDGGRATDAELNYPRYIAVDRNNDLYIADNANHRIRKVDMQTGIINTIAGDGIPGYYGDGGNPIACELYNPEGIAIGGDGKIFIVDKNNNRIRRIASTVSVKDVKSQSENITIFPNPASNEITIKMDNEMPCSITISNTIGQVLIRQEINSTQTRVNTQDIPAGVYYITLNGNSGNRVEKFIKM